MNQEELPSFSPLANSIVAGNIYQHYNGHRYQVLGIARHSETLEELIIYKALYDKGDLWVRPLTMFLETVTIKGRSQLRFKLIE
jgi:hypothetical protein